MKLKLVICCILIFIQKKLKKNGAVHSGTPNSGHYTAFINPDCKNQWIKFNDESVTKSSSDSAINGNYGNGTRTINAYMLAYVKQSSIEDILREISLDEIVGADLIDVELCKELDEQINYDEYFELIVYTSEQFQICDQFKRADGFFNPKYAIPNSFFIQRDKSFVDLYELFNSAFGVSDGKSIYLWSVHVSKDSCRYVGECYKNQALRTIFYKDVIHFFVELPSLNPFKSNCQVLVFIKEFDTTYNKLLYLNHRYFMYSQRIEDIRKYIWKSIKYDGKIEEIAIMYERGIGDYYTQGLLQPSDQIIRAANQHNRSFNLFVVFEIREINQKPKYLRLFNHLNYKKQITPPKPENVINVTIKHDSSKGDELLSQNFQANLKISEIIDKLGDIFVSIEFTICSFVVFYCLCRSQRQKKIIH